MHMNLCTLKAILKFGHGVSNVQWHTIHYYA